MRRFKPVFAQRCLPGKVCRGVEYGCDDGIASPPTSVTEAAASGHPGRMVPDDGNCMTEGTTSMFNSCLKCSPSESSRDWSFNDGATQRFVHMAGLCQQGVRWRPSLATTAWHARPL